MTATADRIAAAVKAAGCTWPVAPCPCTDVCPVDVAGAVAEADDGGTDPSWAAEWDAVDADRSEVTAW